MKMAKIRLIPMKAFSLSVRQEVFNELDELKLTNCSSRTRRSGADAYSDTMRPAGVAGQVVMVPQVQRPTLMFLLEARNPKVFGDETASAPAIGSVNITVEYIDKKAVITAESPQQQLSGTVPKAVPKTVKGNSRSYNENMADDA